MDKGGNVPTIPTLEDKRTQFLVRPANPGRATVCRRLFADGCDGQSHWSRAHRGAGLVAMPAMGGVAGAMGVLGVGAGAVGAIGGVTGALGILWAGAGSIGSMGRAICECT
jgi:hypothetical protein